ncbi:MAG: dxs [Bacteriovoracaceae bacterium]|nr:dxs [Bacteriovoracaceae bacterium]
MPELITTEELKKRYPLSMSISSPDDLKKLSVEQLKPLAEEYRDYLIEVCSRNGGHLGPSLGVVELTFALHRTFDSPKDKIIWDIGHQSYPHKMITGRFERLQTLRQEGGISGFCRRHESVHDILGAGHAGTSLSTAIGICEAYRRNKDPHKVISIIGDAALTSGMAYEALHQSTEYKKNLIVILNDNEMSISPNVGAVNAFLSSKMSSPFINKIHDDLKSAISKIPIVGEDVVEVLSRVKNSFKNLLIPTVIFEGFGFRYFGPLDGHDVPVLLETLENVKQLNEPVLIHIITEKGRGYAPALADKVTFHGCGPYDRETGKLYKEKAGTPPGYTKIFADTLLKLAKKDPKVIAITGAMPSGTGLSVFEKELPSQLYDVGIAEQHAVTFAGGLAIEGYKPFVTIYSTFMQRAYDQIIHDICIQNLNVKFCMDRAGFVGADGATHHGNYDLGFMRTIPNMGICAPRDERELQELVKALDKHIGPASLRYARGSGTGVELYQDVDQIPDIEWGTGEISFLGNALVKEETRPRSIPIEWLERMVKANKTRVDIVLVGIGITVSWAIKAAEQLQKEGINALVLNARFVKPLDGELFRRVAKVCGKMLTIEENVRMAGFGSAVLEFFESEGTLNQLQIKCLGIPDQFYEQATQAALQKEAGIDSDSIVIAARALAGEEAAPTLAKAQ